MAFWQENYQFIKEVYDMRHLKMAEWMENVEKSIARIMADKVYTSAEFKRERDTFNSLCKDLERAEVKKWLAQILEILMAERAKDQRKNEHDKLDQLILKHEELIPNVQKTSVMVDLYWKCYAYGDELKPTHSTTMVRPKGSSKGEPAGEGERTYLIGGNWKCNGTVESVKELIKVFNEAGPIPANTEVVVCAPFIHIPLCLEELRDDIAIGAQNAGVNEKTGAYTGEICASQLKDIGCTWVCIGHSERRCGFEMAGEDNDLVAKKVKTCVDAGLKVMFAIGEKKCDREAGDTLKKCEKQLIPAAKLLTEEDWANVALAYEPVWAIGTGLTATPEMAQETHAGIRNWMAENVSEEVAKNIRIQYGGSMKGANAKDLLAQPDIDGGLIGGASLTADFFNVINGVP